MAVFSAGEVVYAGGFGSSDLERGVPITPRSVFDIGSTSKQFTAACVLLLARDGRLDLDGDIRRHLPELPDLGGPVTVRHLVHHTSGWRDYLNLTLLAGRSIDNDYPEDEVLGLLAAQRSLDFPPGTRHSYSNSGYFLLAEIVRRVTGKSLREVAAERLFGPLGMEGTFVHDDYGELVPDRALAYAPGGDGFRLDMSIWDVTGDGAVFTTVEDLRHWDRQFYDCSLPGGAEFIAELTRPGRLAGGADLDYAFGLMVGSHRGARTISHGGSWGGYRAEMVRFPDLRTTVVVLANLASIDASGLAYQVADSLLAEKLQPISEPEAAARAAGEEGPAPELAGVYVDGERTLMVMVEQRGEETFAHLAGQEFPLARVAPGRAEVQGLPIDLLFEGERLTVAIRGADRWLLDRAPGGGPQPAAVAGRYRADELDAVYEIAGEAGAIRLRRGWQAPEPLVWAAPDIAGSPTGVLAFDAEGFLMGTPRARGLRFRRI